MIASTLLSDRPGHYPGLGRRCESRHEVDGRALVQIIDTEDQDQVGMAFHASVPAPSHASASDNLADGLRAVDEALVQRPGASVLVAGLGGSIPLYTVLCASYLGSEQITFASQDSLGLEIAERLGADCIEVDDWPRKLGSFDITMDCTSHPDGLSSVIKSTSPHGWCTSASIYFAPTTPMPLSDMYMKGIQFRTGRVNSAAQLERVMDLIKNGLEPDKIEPVVYLPEEATHAFEIESISRKIIFDMRTHSSQLV